ncbi:hypothetical protein ACP4OV_014210 [Aristida adscensionis]
MAHACTAMGAEYEAKRSAVTVALLVLVGCRLALALSGLPPPHDGGGDDTAARRRRVEFEPVGYLASVAATVLAACMASAACRGRFSPEALAAEARRTWARPAATALYIELLTAAMASLLLTLRAFLGAVAGAGGGGAGVGLLAVAGSVALVAWLGPVLFAHSDIACRVSLVVAASSSSEEEEEGYGGPAAAVRRAEEVVAGRRARGVAVALVAGAIEQAPAWLCGDGAPALVVGAAVLAAKIAACCACAAFYHDCRRRQGKSTGSRLELEGVTKCCHIGCRDRDMDVAHEGEVEEFESAFESFRLT